MATTSAQKTGIGAAIAVVVGAAVWFLTASTINISGMGSMKPGDTIRLQSKTYSGGKITNLRGIVIDGQGLTSTDAINLAHDTNCVFYNFKFLNNTSQNGCFMIDHDANITIDSLVLTNSTAEMIGIQWHNGAVDGTKMLTASWVNRFHMTGSGAIMANYRSALSNIVDSVRFSNFTVDGQKVVQLMNGNSFFNLEIDHFQINAQNCPIPVDQQNHTLDQGAFEITGTAYLHDGTYNGPNYGWFLRITNFAISPGRKSEVKNVTRIQSTNYGFADYRGVKPTPNIPPFTYYSADCEIDSNICGQMVTTNTFVTPIVVAYPYDGDLYVHGNQRFNSRNVQAPDTAGIINYTNGTRIVRQDHNTYYPLASQLFNDTTLPFNKWTVKGSTPPIPPPDSPLKPCPVVDTAGIIKAYLTAHPCVCPPIPPDRFVTSLTFDGKTWHFTYDRGAHSDL